MLLIELKSKVFALLASIAPSHSVRSVHPSITQDTELEIRARFDLANDAIATTPATFSTAALSDAISSYKDGSALFYRFTIGLTSVRGMDLNVVSE